MSHAERIAVVGCGLIGGSLLRGLKTAGHRDLLAIDADEATLAAIRQELEIATSSSLQDAGTGSLVVLALPIPALLECLPRLARVEWREPAIVTDVGGIKQPVIQAAAALPTVIKFVGGHPMAGKERGGFAHSEATLFQGRTVAICSEEEASAARVETMWKSVGAKPLRCSAQAHDAAVARVSHLPHLVAASLARVAGRGDRLSDALAASGLRDTTRVAEDPTIRFAATRNPSLAALARETADELRQLAEALDRGDSVDALLDEAAAARRRLYPR